MSDRSPLATALFLQSGALLLYELLLTRLFAVTLFADFAHLAIALALLGIAVGAMAVHLRPELVPEEGLVRRVGWLGLLQAVLVLVAVIAAIRFPVLLVSETPPTTYQDRSQIKDNLLDPVWFAALLPVLAAPFAVAGVVFSGIFARRKADVGWLYAADLLGAALGALVFVPLLTGLAGPDLVFVPLAACALAAVATGRTSGSRALMVTGAVATLVSLGLTALAARGEVLPIRTAAGYSEDRVVYTEWTPLTRLAVHRDRRGDYMLLDNASASEIVLTAKRRKEVAAEANRAFVYHLAKPGVRVAILAASAGPEVASAQSLGFTGIDAVDVAGEIFDIVADRYPDSTINPYRSGDTRRVNSDGRAAILRATEPYGVIQMVHANLWSSAGLLSNAWSPALLETKEAFATYLDHLAEDGLISFGKGAETLELIRAAAAALEERGVAEPWSHIVYLGGRSRVMLLRKHAWTAEERAAVDVALLAYPQSELLFDPLAPDPKEAWWKIVKTQRAMTDDHPYADSPAMLLGTLKKVFSAAKGEDTEPVTALYRSIVVQCAIVLVAGVLFLGVPFLLRGRRDVAESRGAGAALGFTACLGYGYLSVETVLIHDLVLFVGHPTYAVTTVVLAMLTFSGLGSAWAGSSGSRFGRGMLLGIVALGAVIAFAVIPVLYAALLWLPLAARIAIVGVTLAPLAFAMGTSFPLGVAAMPTQAARVLPWAWAINAWMSVLGSLATVLIARLYGYSPAFAVALAAYAIAFLLWPRLARVGVS